MGSMTQDQAVVLAVKAVNSALQRDSASGDGIDVVVINKDGVKNVFTKELFIKVEK